MADEFSNSIDALPEVRPLGHILRLLEEALRRDIHFIHRHHQDYPQGLFQCLWNVGWWYDCPQATVHYDVGHLSGVPPWQKSGPKLYSLLESWREQKEQTSDGSTWLRALRPPAIHLGTAQRAVLRGHEGEVNSVSYSPDGARIVSGSRDQTVRVWDASSGAELAVLCGHESYVSSVSYSPDGARIVSGSRDDTVHVWDAASGVELAVLRGHENGVICVSYSPDGARLVTGSFDKTVRVWDAASGAELAVMHGHEESVWCVSYSPDGAYRQRLFGRYCASVGCGQRCRVGRLARA